MPRYINTTNVPLSLAVFLATDDYDYDPDPNVISATTLLKPLRQLVLVDRIPAKKVVIDLSSRVKNRTGQALHKGIEDAWRHNYQQAMRALGYSQHIIDRVRINPEPSSLKPDDIPVYLEQRSKRPIGNRGRLISGKPDLVADGRVEDYKHTATYAWAKDDKTEAYKLQGSIYRWIDPVRITKDEMAINFIFGDWMAGLVGSRADYPPAATAQKLIPLMTLPETEAWIQRKLSLVDEYRDAPEPEIPLCNDAELWRQKPVFKYYKNPAKTQRSTKNFDTAGEAYGHLAGPGGGVGVVIEKPGTVMACKWCPAFDVCTQKDQLIASGDLRM